jgi:acyl-CoA thioester hydrolase
MARHVFRCPLRWSDMDVYGIVNNVVFLRLLEEARVDLIFRLGPTHGDAFFGGGSVVVRHEIEYKRQLVHRHEPVDIEMWVSQLLSATVRIDYEIKDGDTVYATASTTMAPFDYQRSRPRRLTEDETAFFAKYLELAA